MEIYLSTASHQ